MLEDVYEIYKPFRNSIRSLNAEDALQVLWNYAEHLANDRQFDGNIEVDSRYLRALDANKRAILSEWEIELIAKEVILNASRPKQSTKTENLRSWRTMARCVNKLKSIDDLLSKLYGSPDNILIHLHRIAHNQFRFQMYQPSIMLISRYLRLYKYSPLCDLFEQKIGLSPDDYFLVAMVMLGSFLSHPSLVYPPAVEPPLEITEEKMDKVVSRISLPRRQLSELISKEQDYSSRFMFAYNPLRAYPLVEMVMNGKRCLSCPMTILLAWRTTAGVYYDLVSDDGAFKYAFGDAFQSYVGDVLRATVGTGSYQVMPEQSFTTKKGEQRTVDWIVTEDGAALFVECKSKRLTQSAREEIEDLQVLHRDLNALAQAVVQTYKGVEEYKVGRYPQIGHEPDRKIYPVVVTLEDWFFMGALTDYVRQMVSSGLVKAGIDLKIMDEMPYIVCSVQEFEIMAQMLQRRTMRDLLDDFTHSSTYKGWSLDSYFSEVHKAERQNCGAIFADDFDAMLPESLRNR